MKTRLLLYYKEFIDKLRKFKIYDVEQEGYKECMFFVDSLLRNFELILYKKNKIKKIKLSFNELEEFLINKCNYQMVFITSRERKKDIYNLINKVSKKRGICAPFIELDAGVMYFPQLKYADVGLLRYLCEQEKIKKYKLLMMGSC